MFLLISIFLQNLWVIGGTGDAATKTELVNENGATAGPDIPFPSEGLCATQMTSNHGILIGANNNDRTKSLIFNLETFQMDTGPKLSLARDHSACSRFSHANGDQYVIVAGQSTLTSFCSGCWSCLKVAPWP